MKQTKVENWIATLENYPTGTVTKKQLSETTGLSDNTIYDTLKAAHIDTKATSYSVSELLGNFVQARLMLDEGKSYAEVDVYFSAKQQQEPLNDSMSIEEAAGAIQIGLYDEAQLILNEAAKGIAPYVRVMTLNAIASLFSSNDSQLNQARTEFIQSKPTSILEEHIRKKSIRTSQQSLRGGAENKALPEASADEFK